MISSIIRLLSPGQTLPVGEDSRERPRVSLSTPVKEETQAHPSTGTEHRAPTLHSFHNVIFVLSQHSRSGLWSRLDV